MAKLNRHKKKYRKRNATVEWEGESNMQNVAAACAASDKREAEQGCDDATTPKGCHRRDMHVKLSKAKL